jgi:MFS family permease
MFGVAGDRLGSRAMLLAMRTVLGALAALLMTLGLAGALTPGVVLVIAAIGGLVRPNDLVFRNTLIGETIPRDRFANALGMSRTTMDSARVAGALTGAALSATLGVGGAYVVVTIFYAASVLLTLGVAGPRPVPDVEDRRAPLGTVRASGWRELTEGLVHVWTKPALLAPMWLAFLVNLTAYPINSLLPYVAREIYRIDATGLGRLVGSFALGALVGSIGMVLAPRPRRPEWPMLVGMVLWYLALFGFAQTRTEAAGLPVLFVAGLVQSVAMISLVIGLLYAAGDRFRGRVMGVRQLAVYGLPVGLLASGGLIDAIGYPATVRLYCVIGLAFTGVVWARWRASVWRYGKTCS